MRRGDEAIRNDAQVAHAFSNPAAALENERRRTERGAMFTGIVEEMGAVTSLERTLDGTRLTILASTVLGDLKVGDSISINGTCLTVVVKGEQSFVVEVSPETLSVTTLGGLSGGAPVNLERAMKLNERIGGHLVAGHIDGVGKIRSRHQEGNAIVFVIEAPPDVLRYCVHKGSVTVDGNQTLDIHW